MMTVLSTVATASVAPQLRSELQLRRNAARPDAIPAAGPTAVVASGRGRQMLGWLEEVGLLLVLALAFPLIVLVVGTPVVVVARLLIEMGRRWW